MKRWFNLLGLALLLVGVLFAVSTQTAVAEPTPPTPPVTVTLERQTGSGCKLRVYVNNLCAAPPPSIPNSPQATTADCGPMKAYDLSVTYPTGITVTSTPVNTWYDHTNAFPVLDGCSGTQCRWAYISSDNSVSGSGPVQELTVTGSGTGNLEFGTYSALSGFGGEVINHSLGTGIDVQACINGTLPSVTVTKLLWNPTAQAYEPATGWDFTATAVSPTSFTWTLPSAGTSTTKLGTTAGVGGTVKFEWEAASATQIDITETLPGGNTFINYTCKDENGATVDSSSNDMDLTASLTVPYGKAYTCTFRNSPDVPVSLAYFAAQAAGGGVSFDWTTASETANAGFNLYAQTADGMVQLNEGLILSTAVDSTRPVDYTFSAAAARGDAFYIEDVDVSGSTHLHGPYALGEAFGTREAAEAIDWAAIRAEQDAAAEAAAAPAAQTSGALGGKVDLTGRLTYPEFALRVREDGIYRVSYEELAAVGGGLLGVPVRQLALTNNGDAVPMRVIGGRIMRPGVTLEFLGKALDTLYTAENVYLLQVNRELYSKMPTFMGQTPAGAEAPDYYLETAAYEADNEYSIRSISGDPWFDTLLHTEQAKTWTFAMDIDHLAAGAGAALNLELWGSGGAEHHILAAVNDAEVADFTFAGSALKNVNAPVNNLQEGANTLALTVPNDQGAKTDTSALEAYGLTYPRAFVARDGRLAFSAAAQAFVVSGFPDNDVVAYYDGAQGPQRIFYMQTQQAGDGYSAAFAGNGAGTYYVSSAGSVLQPAIALSAPAVDISSGTADLLIISHPSFISGLAPLVAAREAQGYTVKVVDVNDVYRAYSGGIFDAEAIRLYIHDAIAKMGVQYVLLVGGDTTNYRGYNNSLSMSFVPTLYARTDQEVFFAPVDPLYTDVNGDNVPDAALGRFPVRTAGDLARMVEKTLLYDQKEYGSTAVFAADSGFGGQSAQFVSALKGSWAVQEANLDGSSLAAARSTLLGALNDGVALASFVGHSADNRWSGSSLLTSGDAKALTNYGKPFVVSQYGCWNTYYVDPDYSSLGHQFLLSGTNGAAVAMGASSLTAASSGYELGKRLTPLLSTPGMTTGTAVLQAKADLAKSDPHVLDVLLGWTILGDPTTVIQR